MKVGCNIVTDPYGGVPTKEFCRVRDKSKNGVKAAPPGHSCAVPDKSRCHLRDNGSHLVDPDAAQPLL